jgi:hypothetical protein
MAMTERGGILGWLGLGGLVSVLGFLLGGSAPSAPASTPEPAASSQPSLPPGVASGRLLLEAYLSDGREPSLEEAAGRFELRILIATLPDPVDTHLDWLFDSNLDALKRAFETAGYVIDRFWLPWGRDDRPAAPFASPAPRAEERPGVLLFRGAPAGAGGKPRLGLLYVVGESPTSGVKKAALRAALEERRDLLTTLLPSDAGQAVPMVAPVFSGSADSLVRVLEGFRLSSGASFVLRSGTATATDSRALLHAPAEGRDFAATIHSDASLLKVLCSRIVGPLGLRNDQVAVLKESTTEYGQARDMSWRCPGDARFLVLPFPMNISGLRAVYPAPAPAKEPQEKVPTGEEPPRLPLSLTDPLRPSETIPAFSGVTAPSIDIEFDALARVISHQGVRLVSILATDVRDTLFLATELRRRTRDVQLVTLESNDLYLRSEYRDALRGMLVVSTYPLLEPEARRLRGQRLAFTNGAAEGTYNATLALLGLPGALIDYQGLPDDEDVRVPAPPVWVSVVGDGGMLPLAAEPLEDERVLAVTREDPIEKAAARPARRPQRLEPVTLAMVVLFGIALVLGAPVLARHPAVAPPPPPAVGAPYRTVRRYMERMSITLHSHIYAALALLALASLYLPLALVALRRQRFAVSLLPFVGLVGASVLLLFGRSAARAAALAFATRATGVRFALFARWPSRGQQCLWALEVAARLAVSLAGILYAGLLAWFLAWILYLDRWPFRFLAVRALQLDDGVSPLLPLACGAAGFASWSIWHLLRIRALAQPSDYELCLGASASFESARARAVRQRLFLAVPEAAAVGTMAGLFVVAAWLGLGFSGTLESIVARERFTPFDLLLPAVVLAGVCTTAWGVCRLLLTWRALRAYLEALGRTPLNPAFARLPGAMPSLARLTPWSDGRDAISSVATSLRPLLRRLLPRDDAGLPGALEPGLRRRVTAAMKEGDPRAELAVLRRCLVALWAVRPEEEALSKMQGALDRADRATATSDAAQATFAGPWGLWLRAAEEYVAVQASGYVESVLRHLRVLAAFLLASLLLTTVMLSSYPFQPQGLAKLCFSFVLAAAVLALVGVISDMNRNELLSRLSRTSPGRVTWDLGYLLHLALFAVTPLLALVGSELPWVRGVLFAWVDPLLRALTKS